MARRIVAVDVGGTFTDVCVVDEAGDGIRVAGSPGRASPGDRRRAIARV